jgi:glycosyltransferase involved in cell wall biosynthesis
VKRYSDPRINLICHERNLGVCPARNTGIKVSTGLWIVTVNSDDELLPGALSAMHQRATDVSERISGLRFRCQLDSGEVSPSPWVAGEVWDYEGYLRWIEAHIETRQESLPCYRRITFETVLYPEDRSLELQFHLKFNRRFLSLCCPEVVHQYHTGLINRLSTPPAEVQFKSAKDQAAQMQEILSEHGAALAKWAPNYFSQQRLGLATQYFLSGKRLVGSRIAVRCLLANPLAIKAWAVLCLGLLDRRLVANAKNAVFSMR